MAPRIRNALIVAAALLTLAGVLAYEIVATRPVRRAVRAYSELIAVANALGVTEEERIEAARPYISSRLRALGPIRMAPEGGVVGLPRYINKNFQAWREGDEVWICPSNRVGFVYRLVEEEGRWRFDGLVGLLQSRNVLIPMSEAPE